MLKYDYRHGDHYVYCDISGFKVHASETRMTWDGLRVRKEDWDYRHPQDFVKGQAYRQNVQNPRPEPEDDTTDTQTTLSGDEATGQTVISVSSTNRIAAGDSITIYLDNDQTHTSTVDSIGSGTVTISTALPSPASSGNHVSTLTNGVSL